MNRTWEQWDIITSVGLTALVVAAARSLETHRVDRLIEDPYAEAFVHAAAPPVPMPTRPDEDVSGFWQVTAPSWGVRSRFFDDYVTDAVIEGVRQVVVLAAGLDARAYRLEWAPDTHLYELDQPKVLEFKQQVLDDQGAIPRCQRHVVAADLREDWVGALRAAGFDPAAPAAWLAEGLLLYLPGEAEETLFERIHELAAPGSRIAYSVLPPAVQAAITDSPALTEMRRAAGVTMPELWPGDQRRHCATWLSSVGWRVTVETRSEAAQRYGRTLERLLGPSKEGELVTALLPHQHR